MGDSGTHKFSGIITGEEYNFDLVGRKALKVWEQMRRSDASVGASLKAIKYPIKATKFFTAPASEDDPDIEISNFVHWNLFSRLKWKKVLGEILTYLEMGYAIFEMVFEVEVVDGVERVVLTKLGFRKQTGLESWQAGPDMPGITFRKSDGKSVGIPLDKLIVFTNEQEGDNYEGVSILRTAYKHWFYVDKFDQIDALGHERHSLGVPKIKYPRTATDPEREAARETVRNLRANEQSFIEEPEGWEILFMDMQSHSLKDIGPSIDRHDRQITKNVLAQFLELGSSGASGGRAVSEDQHILLNQSIESVLDYIADTLGYVVKTLVDLNFTVDQYPTIKHGDVNQKDVKALADAVEKFVKAGVITPTEADEDHVRQLIEFPKLSDEDKQERSNAKTAAKKVTADTRKTPAAVVAQVSARDIPGLYDGTDIDPSNLGCIMIDTETLDVMKHVPAEFAGDLIQATKPEDHAMGAVAETEAHVTLLYGLLENGNIWKDKVDAVLKDWSLDTVTIADVDYFDVGDSFAVIAHIEKTPELIDGHERLTLLPHIQTFSEYRPHLTLAYVSKYADIDDWVDHLGTAFNGQTLKTTGINYGDLPEGGSAKEANALKSLAGKVSASLTRLLYGDKNRAA